MLKKTIVNSPERNAMLRHAFLESAGVTDEVPYAGMSVLEAIETVLKAADIVKSKIGPTIDTGGKLVVYAQSEPSFARALGQKVSPLLDAAEYEGRIIRHSVEVNPLWYMRLRQQKAAERKHLEKLFYKTSGIEPEVDVYHPEIHMTMEYYCDLLLRNTGLTQAKIGERFTPPVSFRCIHNRMDKTTLVDEEFTIQFANAIRPELASGAKEGWLDFSYRQLSFDSILKNQLGVSHGFLKGKMGTSALLYCIAQSHVPVSAICAMVGEERTWLNQSLKSKPDILRKAKWWESEKSENMVSVSDVAKIARAIKPYIHGKQWNGIVEVMDPMYLANHQCVRNYVVDNLRRQLPSHLADDMENVLTELHQQHPETAETLGPALSALRQHVGLDQYAFGQPLLQSRLTALETNCFNPRCVDEKGQLKETMRKRLERFVEVVAERWLAIEASSSWVGKEKTRAGENRLRARAQS